MYPLIIVELLTQNERNLTYTLHGNKYERQAGRHLRTDARLSRKVMESLFKFKTIVKAKVHRFPVVNILH